MAAGILSPGLSRLLVPQYLIPTLFYRVQLPFSQSGVLIELSSGYLKVVARLGLVFVWNDDDSLLVRMGMGVGGQSLLVKWGRWVEPLSEMRRWVRRGGIGHTAGEGGHPSINRVSGSSPPDIGPVYVGCLPLSRGFI